MKKLRVRHVIELAAGLANIPYSNLEDPTSFLIADSIPLGAAILVAWVNTDASIDDIARIFAIDAEFLREWLPKTDPENWLPEFETFADSLQMAVRRLKAAWRREAEMQRWRAQQEPTPREYGPWRPRDTRQNVELTRSRMKPVRSIWTEEAAR